MPKQILLSLLLVFLAPVLSWSQQSPEKKRAGVPEELQVPIFLKILTYDRSLEKRVEDTIRIGVLYFPDTPRSRKNKDAFVENLELNKNKTVNGVPFSFTEIRFVTKERLDQVTGEGRINVLYVTSGGSNLRKSISKITQAKKILTITGRADYVTRGISIGLAVKEERPEIVVNLRSARAEGSDLSASLLRLCRVIDQG
ncbi:MAG: YfiR family protein [Candidatus Zixiibacteriota bacterium]|nr:MAG: YfiR family protein [candidate division Zixibacteria bacterium]